MASPQPVFYLLAGPNGAGKSTLYQALKQAGQIQPGAEFVNADLYEAKHLQDIADPVQRSAAARDWADTRRAQLLVQGKSFVSETVFSHASKLQLIAQDGLAPLPADRKSTRLNSSHRNTSRMPSSA